MLPCDAAKNDAAIFSYERENHSILNLIGSKVSKSAYSTLQDSKLLSNSLY